eukprot:TRINITY_DN8769_c0_g1_i1.p1 TRINITY_DN8769_c0_g1~~TRINITY_DN8769_c0_g1_i1.p1  ORF type:complete len:962 (+),score=180.77 TRINITY_DN8769_c0_g1_i1:27-2888(+)
MTAPHCKKQVVSFDMVPCIARHRLCSLLIACSIGFSSRYAEQLAFLAASHCAGRRHGSWSKHEDPRTSLFAADVDTFDPWTVLGVSARASADEARIAYKRLIAKYHPDIDSSIEAQNRFQQIVRAYAIVTGADKTLDAVELLNNAVKNLRNDLELKRAQKQQDQEQIRRMEIQLAETELKRDTLASDFGFFGGAALGLLGGPAFAVLGAIAGLSVSKREDVVGHFVRTTGKFAKGMFETLGNTAWYAAVRNAADISHQFKPGQRATILRPPEHAGIEVTIEAVLGNTCSVRLDTGVVANVATRDIEAVAAMHYLPKAAATAAPVAFAAHATLAADTRPEAALQDDEASEFAPGQRVVLLAPPAMAGKQGSILGPAPGRRYEVQFDSGSIFHIAMEYIQDAAKLELEASAAVVATTATAVGRQALPAIPQRAAEQDSDELTHERLTSGGPPALADERGTVLRPASADAKHPGTASEAASKDDEKTQVEFSSGQQVKVLGPSAMAGKRGYIVRPAPGFRTSSYEVQFESGSVFNILADNIVIAMERGAAPTSVISAPAAPTSSAASASQDVGTSELVPLRVAPEPAADTHVAMTLSTANLSTTALTGAAIAKKEKKEKMKFMLGQKVMSLWPPKMAGEIGTVAGYASGEVFLVRYKSGSVFQISAKYLQEMSGVPSAGAMSNAPFMAATPTISANAEQGEEMRFMPGQQVSLLGPPKMAGKRGIILGAAPGGAFLVRFESGSVFSILAEYLQDAVMGVASEAPSSSLSTLTPNSAMSAACDATKGDDDVHKNGDNDDDALPFLPGQPVMVLGPPKMAGKKGTIVRPAAGNSFLVRLESGSIFQISREYLEDAVSLEAVAVPSTALSHSQSSTATPSISALTDDAEELQFVSGQRVVVLGPPAMAGKKGTIVGPPSGGTFPIRFESGSVFQILTVNVRDATSPVVVSSIDVASSRG